MCSLAAMPELLVSHSPPDYFYRPRYTPPPPPKPSPSRPCLASPPPRAAKKKVVFADDKGYSLTQVRVMREPSNAPPTWSLQFLAQVMRDLEPAAVAAAANEAATPTTAAAAAAAAAEPERWLPEFAQPASDYLQFRERLDSGNVSLENVIVRDAEGVFTGTVKVRNLSFHKEVKLRWTADGWKTYSDEPCSYVENPVACSSAYVLYDTFSFRVALPPANPRDESSSSSSSSSSATTISSTTTPASSSPVSPPNTSSASVSSTSSSSSDSNTSSSTPSSPANATSCSSSDSDSKTTKPASSSSDSAQPQEPSRRVEFCVCFRCGGHEYWDSNGGANYALVRRSPSAATPAPAAAPASTAASSPAGAGSEPGQGAEDRLSSILSALRASRHSRRPMASRLQTPTPQDCQP